MCPSCTLLGLATSAYGPLYGGWKPRAELTSTVEVPVAVGALVPQLPSLPLCTHTSTSSRTASGALARSVCRPAVGKLTTARPSAPVLTVLAPPDSDAPATGALVPEGL